MCVLLSILYIESPLKYYHTVQQLFICFVPDRIILLLTFKSLQLPFFPWRSTNYIPKRYFIIFTNTKGLQLFPEKLFCMISFCEIMLQIYCVLAITQYCRHSCFCFFLSAFLYVYLLFL